MTIASATGTSAVHTASLKPKIHFWYRFTIAVLEKRCVWVCALYQWLPITKMVIFFTYEIHIRPELQLSYNCDLLQLWTKPKQSQGKYWDDMDKNTELQQTFCF